MMQYIRVDPGRKLNVHETFKTSWTSSEHLMYVQFTSCVYGDTVFNVVAVYLGPFLVPRRKKTSLFLGYEKLFG